MNMFKCLYWIKCEKYTKIDSVLSSCSNGIYKSVRNKMCLQNMITIGTLLFATINIGVALSYHIAIEPESSLQYNGISVSISISIIIACFSFLCTMQHTIFGVEFFLRFRSIRFTWFVIDWGVVFSKLRIYTFQTKSDFYWNKFSIRICFSNRNISIIDYSHWQSSMANWY